MGLKIILVVVVGVLAIVASQVWGPVLTGASFLAKRHCSRHLLAPGPGDVTGAAISLQEEFAIKIFRYLPLHVVHQPDRVEVWLFGQIKMATAHYHPGIGCILNQPTPPCVEQPQSYLEEPVPLPENAALEEEMRREFANVFSNGVHQNVRALVIMHKGKIIAERYRAPWTRNTRQHGWSMTKSWLNTLLGVRVEEGVITMDDYVKFPNGTVSDRLKLGHLLNMTSGLDWEEYYGPGGNPTQMLTSKPHMAQYVADRGFKYEPGSYWHYSSGDSNLLGWHLMNTFPSKCEFYKWQRQQWNKMGLKSILIEPDNVGNMVFSSYGWATPRDWARWGNLQLKSTWAAQTTKLVDVSLTTGKKKPYAGQFWLPQTNSSDFFNGFSAQGFEFQYTTMLPQHDLVVTQLACAKGDDYIQHMVSTHNSFVERVIKALP